MVTVLNTYIYLYLCLNLTFIHCLYLNNEISVDLPSNDQKHCGSSNSIFYTEINSTLTNCLVLCGVRPRCKAVNFKRHLSNFCELLLDTKKSVRIQPGCLYIDRHDVVYSERLNNSCGCNTTEVCELSDNTCYTKECLPVKKVDHGEVLGDIYSLDSRLFITCDLGYTLADNVTVIVCQQNGQWSTDPICKSVTLTTDQLIQNQSFPITWMSTGTSTKTTTTGFLQSTTSNTTHLLETSIQTSSSTSSSLQTNATFTTSSIATILPITHTTSSTITPPSKTTSLTSLKATSRSTTQISLNMVPPPSINTPLISTTTPPPPTTTKTTSTMTSANSLSTSTISTTPSPSTTIKTVSNTTLTHSMSSPSISTTATPTTILTNSKMVPSSITTPSTYTMTTSTDTRTKTTSNTVQLPSITTSTTSITTLSSSSMGIMTSKITTLPTMVKFTSTTSIPYSKKQTTTKVRPNTVSSTISSSSLLQELKSSTTSTSTATTARTSTTTQTPMATCPNAWYKFGFSCYLFTANLISLFRNKRDFSDAEYFCNHFYGSHLASVNSEEEDLFIRNKVQELAHRGYDSYWLGMKQNVNTYEWQWTDGQPVNYTNWRPGQPEDNWENCLSLWESDGWTWHDVDCGEKALFVCKKSATFEH